MDQTDPNDPVFQYIVTSPGPTASVSDYNVQIALKILKEAADVATRDVSGSALGTRSVDCRGRSQESGAPLRRLRQEARGRPGESRTGHAVSLRVALEARVGDPARARWRASHDRLRAEGPVGPACRLHPRRHDRQDEDAGHNVAAVAQPPLRPSRSRGRSHRRPQSVDPAGRAHHLRPRASDRDRRPASTTTRTSALPSAASAR